MKKLKIRRWYDNWFTSRMELNDAYVSGIIDRIIQETVHGANYTFLTKKGEQIATFYKDATFGFCSQAYGVKLGIEVVNSMIKSDTVRV